MIWGGILAWGKNGQTCSVAQPASCLVGTMFLFWWGNVKWVACEVNHSFSSSAEFKIECSCTFFFPLFPHGKDRSNVVLYINRSKLIWMYWSNSDLSIRECMKHIYLSQKLKCVVGTKSMSYVKSNIALNTPTCIFCMQKFIIYHCWALLT